MTQDILIISVCLYPSYVQCRTSWHCVSSGKVQAVTSNACDYVGVPVVTPYGSGGKLAVPTLISELNVSILIFSNNHSKNFTTRCSEHCSGTIDKTKNEKITYVFLFNCYQFWQLNNVNLLFIKLLPLTYIFKVCK